MKRDSSVYFVTNDRIYRNKDFSLRCAAFEMTAIAVSQGGWRGKGGFAAFSSPTPPKSHSNRHFERNEMEGEISMIIKS